MLFSEKSEFLFLFDWSFIDGRNGKPMTLKYGQRLQPKVRSKN